MKTRYLPLLAGTVSMLSLSACSLMPALESPSSILPAAFTQKAAQKADDVTKASPVLTSRWWELYQDPVLTGLLDQALMTNPDIPISAARLAEAQAVARDAAASQLPQIDAGFNAARSQVSTTTSVPIPSGSVTLRNNFRLALSTAFELDFFGKLRSASEGAKAQLLSTQYARDTTLISISASIVQTYFLIRSLDDQLRMTQANLANREETLALVQKRVNGGVSSDLELNQAIAARAQLAVQLRDLMLQRAQAQNLLAVLVGQPALEVPAVADRFNPVVPMPPVGLPSELLTQRPDIAQAEQNIVISNARIGVAKANLYPSISLTSSLGGESKELSDVTIPGSRIFSLGFGLSLPVFDGGRFSARADAAVANQQQAVAVYQKTVLTAFREVQDALAAQRERKLSSEDGLARVVASREALRIAQARYDAGYSQYLDVLDAQRTLNEAEIAYSQIINARLSASVDLVKAVGGGWTKPR